MGTREHRAQGHPDDQPTALELWTAGEPDDEADDRVMAVAPVLMTGLLVALAAFFLVFAPGV
jgi:hypothetical protein